MRVGTSFSVLRPYESHFIWCWSFLSPGEAGQEYPLPHQQRGPSQGSDYRPWSAHQSDRGERELSHAAGTPTSFFLSTPACSAEVLSHLKIVHLLLLSFYLPKDKILLHLWIIEIVNQQAKGLDLVSLQAIFLNNLKYFLLCDPLYSASSQRILISCMSSSQSLSYLCENHNS